MMGWHGAGTGWGASFGMGLFWLALLGVILYLVVRLLPTGGPRPRPHAVPDSAQEVLDRRYARGEIDTESYQTQRAALVSARDAR